MLLFIGILERNRTNSSSSVANFARCLMRGLDCNISMLLDEAGK